VTTSRLGAVVLAALLLVTPLSGCLAGTPLDGAGERIRKAFGGDDYEMRRPSTGPREPPPDDTEEVDPVLQATDQALAPLPWDRIVDGADQTTGTGTFFEDLSRQHMRHWYVKNQWDRVSNQQREPYTYPGPGHPDYNLAGHRLNAEFESPQGDVLDGSIFLPFRSSIAAYEEDTDGHELPILLFYHGLGADKEAYYWWPQQMARQGYIVLTFDFPGHGDSEGRMDHEMWQNKAETAQAALTYILEDSPVASVADGDRVGVFGNSMGGITALEHQAVDDRVDAVVSTAPVSEHNVDVPSSDTPIQIQTSDHDGPIAPLPFTGPQVTRGIYEDLEGPKEFIVIGNGNHGSWINLPFVPAPTYSWDVATQYGDNWFHYWLKDSQGVYQELTTPHQHLSQVHKSEYDFDGEQGVLAGAFPPEPPSEETPVLTGTEETTVEGMPVTVRWTADLEAPALRVDATWAQGTLTADLAWTGQNLAVAVDGRLPGSPPVSLQVGGTDEDEVTQGPSPALDLGP
jgi:dienelactone hydrolase